MHYWTNNILQYKSGVHTVTMWSSGSDISVNNSSELMGNTATPKLSIAFYRLVNLEKKIGVFNSSPKRIQHEKKLSIVAHKILQKYENY